MQRKYNQIFHTKEILAFRFFTLNNSVHLQTYEIIFLVFVFAFFLYFREGFIYQTNFSKC